MNKRNAELCFGSREEFLKKYRTDLQKGKIYSLRTGKEVGAIKMSDQPYRYFTTNRNGRKFYIKRSHLIFWSGYGYLPCKSRCIDHIDGNAENDSLENLQEISNGQNQIKRINNNKKHQYYGIYFDKEKNKYKAYASKNNKMYHAGYSQNMQEAAHMHDLKTLDLYWKDYLQDGFMPPLNFPNNLQKYSANKIKR